jgi:hypothetical protein
MVNSSSMDVLFSYGKLTYSGFLIRYGKLTFLVFSLLMINFRIMEF